MATTNDLKNGIVLKLDGGQLWSVVEFQHVKPGKGPAFVRTKLKNVLSGKIVDKTFNAGTKVATVHGGRLDLDAGVEGLVDDLAGQHVLELGAHECGALAGLDVLELDDLVDGAVDFDVVAVLELVRADHGAPTSMAQAAGGRGPASGVSSRTPLMRAL